MVEINGKYKFSTIAEMNDGIILANFERDNSVRESTYQTEAMLEEKLIDDLVMQGYERLYIKDAKKLYDNLRAQIQRLNKVSFSDSEWDRFLVEYLDCPNDGVIEKTRKIQEDYIYDFTFDDRSVKNIKIIDKKDIHNNFLQVVNQVEQIGIHKNRYDVTILINGLPLLHIELKSRGNDLRQAYEQIDRYIYESFNTGHSLYKYVQIFVISNGTQTRYFANTTVLNKKNYEFTCEWADAKNKVINDLEDFTKTFFEKRVLLEVITKYCVFDVNNTLLIMRPYQIAATERILWKINSSFEHKKAGTIDSGGFIWHTTGSGKTLTSFKTARLATSLPYIDKVFFIVDRKDLDYQTMKEYQRFQPDSVNGSKDTKELKSCIEKDDNKIVVTTIQKLNEFVKKNKNHSIYTKHCVLIYDECHRSLFGDAQRNIKRSFKKYYQFGFTGTPIFEENTLGAETTASLFGAQLHSYVITDAIRDGKVLKFKVDYCNISSQYKNAEMEQDEVKLKQLENKFLLHNDRISKVAKHILKVFNTKTHRNQYYDIREKRKNGFNAMFAVESVSAAKLYYEEFERLQQEIPVEKRLRIATIYSYAANEQSNVKGDISDENFTPKAMDYSAKRFLDKVIMDYNKEFKTNFSTESNEFQNYYKDLSNKVKNREIDLLIVVGMFLTGFDAPTLNTLFVDKNLRYHGLIQAYSRTNRILNKLKPFGNIVCFRNLEEATKGAIKLFGDENSIKIILERKYEEYIEGYEDEQNGKFVKGYEAVCKELLEKYSDPTSLELEIDKRNFVILFGEYIKLNNILRNYDQFQNHEKIIPERLVQDMKSVYIDLKPKPKPNPDCEKIPDFPDIEFHVDILKSEEINLDYILALILEKTMQNKDASDIEEDIRNIVRSSVSIKAKEDLLVEYIKSAELSKLENVSQILENFYSYAREKKNEEIDELIAQENLKSEARHFIENSIKKGFVSRAGDDPNNCITNVSRIGGARERKKAGVLEKIRNLVEVFFGI